MTYSRDAKLKKSWWNLSVGTYGYLGSVHQLLGAPRTAAYLYLLIAERVESLQKKEGDQKISIGIRFIFKTGSRNLKAKPNWILSEGRKEFDKRITGCSLRSAWIQILFQQLGSLAVLENSFSLLLCPLVFAKDICIIIILMVSELRGSQNVHVWSPHCNGDTAGAGNSEVLICPKIVPGTPPLFAQSPLCFAHSWRSLTFEFHPPPAMSPQWSGWMLPGVYL